MTSPTILKTDLLSAVYSGGTLETLLASNTAKGALRDLVSSTVACRQLFGAIAAVSALLGSDRAFDEIKNSETAIIEIANNWYSMLELCKVGEYLGAILSNVARSRLFIANADYALLQSIVNVSGYALKRTTYTTGSGNWVKPTNLYALASAGIGSGGSGGGANNTAAGPAGGGSGGEAKTALHDHTAVSGNLAYSVGAATTGGAGNADGSNGNATTFDTAGALLNCAGGLKGNKGVSTGGTGGASAGTTSGGGRSAMTDTDFSTAAWQCVTASQASGRGAQGLSYLRNGQPGLKLDGFGRGRWATTAADQQSASSWGGGGGGGSSDAGSGSSLGSNGANGTKGGGGGGATREVNATKNGGDGGEGELTVYHVTDA